MTIHAGRKYSRLFYSAQDIKALKKHFRKSPTTAEALGLISQRKMSQLAGISYDSYRKLLLSGRVPEPKVRHGARTYYRKSEVQKMLEAYGAFKPSHKRGGWAAIRAEGLYCGADAARALEMPYVSFQLWVSKKKLPPATRTLPGRLARVYDAQDVENMKRMLVEKGYKGYGRMKAGAEG